MDSPSDTPKPSPSAPKRWKRVAGGVAVFLLCYFVVAYVIAPQLWKTYARHRPSFDDNPRLTETGDGHPGGAINVALTGSESQVKGIMRAAKWHPADALGLKSDLKIGVDSVLSRSYDEAPVSKLFLYGRPEDFAFEQPVGDDPRHRHHVRFWRSKNTDQDRPIWVGAASYDERIGLSHTTGQITHHTGPDIDAERAYVFDTLQRTGDLAEMYKVPGFHKQLEGINGGGDRWYTDGALWVGVIKKGFAGVDGAATDLQTRSAESGPTVTASVLQADLRAHASSRVQISEVLAEIELLAAAAPWRAGGFLDAGQQDQIEGLLFRYLACRHALWHLANYHRDNESRYPDAEIKAKSAAIAFDAGFAIILSDASLVSAFRDDTVAIDKLNEEFYRSRIPPRTYERLRLGITDETQLAALRDSFLLYTSELDDPDSAVAKIVRRDSVYNDLVNETKAAAKNADAIVGALVDTQSPLMPDLENELRHTRVAQLLRGSEAEAGNLLFAARAHLFKGVSRIKNPEAHLIKFSADQKQQVYDALQPGDIILTFTAGYISDIFIPGAFKHAITFVGSPQDRQSAGLTADDIVWLPDAEREVLLKSLGVDRLSSGQNADVIEAVGEGVIFNHLGHIMDTHINRLLVLRPKVSSDDRIHALANVFLFLGDGYDFKFDFADASKQVCTEVVYRALDGKGPIQFSLVERAGHETLSADDIANDFLAAPGKAFDFVLFAEQAPGSKQHRARVFDGEDGASRLREVMTAQNQ